MGQTHNADTSSKDQYLYLKSLYTAFYKILLEQLFKELKLENIEYNIFYSNSLIPYYINELSGYELNADNVKRVINMLDESDKK